MNAGRSTDSLRNPDGFFRGMQGCCFSVERDLLSLYSFKNSFRIGFFYLKNLNRTFSLSFFEERYVQIFSF